MEVASVGEIERGSEGAWEQGRLCESPPIRSERYERRPCLGRVRCTCRSSDFFYYSSKTDSWGRSLKVTAPR